jgi:serine/threonine protein kinase
MNTFSGPPKPGLSTLGNELSTPPAFPPIGPSPLSLLPTLFGDYEILEEVARGGMGIVYKARQVSLGRIVALKMILAHKQESQETVERFYREARAAAVLDHPHIVPIHEVGYLAGQHFYSMAFIEGTSLKGLIHDQGPLSITDAVSLLVTVAEAVAFAHDHGIIHRDLKPENVLIDQHGRPRVADFGLAKLPMSDSALTGTGQPLGTPSYMPPEQARGQLDRIGPCSDVFSLGGILYFLMTGHPPFQADNVVDILHHVLYHEPIPPQRLNPQASPALAAVCLKCLEKDPDRRYPSVRALIEALHQAAAAPSESHLDAQEISPGVRAPARHSSGFRLRWYILAAAFLFLIGTSALVAWRIRENGLTDVEDAEVEPQALLPRPEELRQDFGLEVTMLGGRKGEDGVASLDVGERVGFRVKVQQEAYVGVWTIETDGTVLCLFPCRGDLDHHFKAGESRDVPAFRVRAIPSQGKDAVWVVASTRKWTPLAGQLQGPFQLFKQDRDRRAWIRQLRGLRHDPKPLAETVLWYRVQPSGERQE